MEPEHPLVFGPFHVEGPQGGLWQGAQAIALRPQALALLRSLVAHPGRLVTKAEVRRHVWADTHVTDTALRVGVHEIRRALGDVAAAPRYLETVGRQGYRFLLGEDREGPPALTTRPLVGRRDDVEAIVQWCERAAHGARQCVLVSGEAGIGKTTVVEMVLARLSTSRGVRIVRGQCVEHYGAGEPYLLCSAITSSASLWTITLAARINLLYAPPLRHATHCCINRFQSSSRFEMPG
jgi:hypothetical protein